jgi:acetolactate synthase-1/2/3 large subunit
MKGTELVLQALVNNDVKYIFGYTGGAIVPIFDEMVKQKESTGAKGPLF